MGNILQEVQSYVVGKLSADSQLSGNCTFLAENRKDIEFEIKNTLGRQGIVGVVMTPKATYAGKYEDLFLAWTLEELEIDIVENVVVNRGKKDGEYMTGQEIGLRVFDVLCPLNGEYEGQFCPQSIEEGEDSGLLVNKCVLKALVYGEGGPGPGPEPVPAMQFVKLLDEPPAPGVQPKDGWMWESDGGFVLWKDGEAKSLGEGWSQLSSQVESMISAKADLSALENYLPLSGDEDAQVAVNLLSCNALAVGRPQEDGVGEGVLVYEGRVSLQLAKHTMTTNYYGTEIAGDGTIEQYSKSGGEELVTYAPLRLPRKTTGGT